MPHDRDPEAKPRSLTVPVVLGAALFAFIQSFTLLSPILLSFLLVVLISLAVNPVIVRMRVLTGGRKIPTGLVVGGFIALLVLTGWAFFGPMKESFINLSEQMPSYWERLQKPLIRMEQKAALSEQKLQEEVTTEIAQAEKEAGAPVPLTPIIKAAPVKAAPAKAADDSGSLRTSLGGMLQGVAGSFTAVAFNGAQFLVVLVTIFFGVLFTLLNPRPLMGALFALVPEHHHAKALIVMQRIGTFAPRWAGAMLVGMVSIGLLVFLFMLPIFGFSDALVLGLIAGVLEAIPFLGPILSSVPALLLALGAGGMTPVWVVLAYVVVQALENNVIIPFVMAGSMKVHPAAVIFSMLLCVAAFGVLGVLIAAPLVAVVDILHDELYRKRFLPTVTDANLDALARKALREKE